MGMNVGVTLGTCHAFLGMYTGIVLRVLFFVATFALDLLNFDLFSHMLGKISYIYMTAGAGILAMDRSGKIMNRHLVAVAPQTGGWINCHSLFGMYGKYKSDSQEHR
jgi:hypothetical protein